MFNLTIATSFVASTLVTAGVAVVASATPATNNLHLKTTEFLPNVSVCTGDAAAGIGCVTIPISCEACVNFLKGLSFLNKEVSGAVIPEGMVCTFYEPFSCLSSQDGTEAVVLQEGTWNFSEITGTAGTVDFNDLSSSFNCSAL